MTAVQYSRSRDDEGVLKSKLSENWTRPSQISRVGPYASAPDGKTVGNKSLCLDLASGLRAVNAKHRVSVMI